MIFEVPLNSDPRAPPGAVGTPGNHEFSLKSFGARADLEILETLSIVPREPLGELLGALGFRLGILVLVDFRNLQPHGLARGVCRDCLLIVRDDCVCSIFKGKICESVKLSSTRSGASMPSSNGSNGGVCIHYSNGSTHDRRSLTMIIDCHSLAIWVTIHHRNASASDGHSQSFADIHNSRSIAMIVITSGRVVSCSLEIIVTISCHVISHILKMIANIDSAVRYQLVPCCVFDLWGHARRQQFHCLVHSCHVSRNANAHDNHSMNVIAIIGVKDHYVNASAHNSRSLEVIVRQPSSDIVTDGVGDLLKIVNVAIPLAWSRDYGYDSVSTSASESVNCNANKCDNQVIFDVLRPVFRSCSSCTRACSLIDAFITQCAHDDRRAMHVSTFDHTIIVSCHAVVCRVRASPLFPVSVCALACGPSIAPPSLRRGRLGFRPVWLVSPGACCFACCCLLFSNCFSLCAPNFSCCACTLCFACLRPACGAPPAFSCTLCLPCGLPASRCSPADCLLDPDCLLAACLLSFDCMLCADCLFCADCFSRSLFPSHCLSLSDCFSLSASRCLSVSLPVSR